MDNLTPCPRCVALEAQLKAIQDAWFHLDRLDIGDNYVVNGGEKFDALYRAINPQVFEAQTTIEDYFFGEPFTEMSE